MNEAKILNGKELAEAKFLELRARIVNMERNKSAKPALAIIMVGNDPASQLYVRNKKKSCHKIGIYFNDYRFSKDISEKDVLETIEFLNNDQAVYGIVVQLPLPSGFDTQKIIKSISSNKDVDGFHPDNFKKFEFIYSAINNKKNPEKLDGIVMPPVLSAVIILLDCIEENLANKRAIIISKNEIFVFPLKTILKLKSIKPEVVSPLSDELNIKLKEADIVISAVGRPNFIKSDMIKKGAILIDVGITLIDDRLAGDVDFEECKKKASYISPVPGGIGPLTVAYLLDNVIKFCEQKQ